MRLFTRFMLAALLMAAAPLCAAERAGDQGLGLILGNPSGVSYKAWLSNEIAIDAAVGVDRSEFDVHATLLYHDFNWFRSLKAAEGGAISWLRARGEMGWYAGVGPRMLFEENEELGIRLPVGLSYFVNNSPWEIFCEAAPVLRLTPDTGFNGDIAVGARFYFEAIRPVTRPE